MLMKRIISKVLILTVTLFTSRLFAQAPDNTKVVRYPTELEEKQLSLDCKWDYFDSAFIDPGFFYNRGVDEIKDISVFGGKRVSLPFAIENGQGYATYHCRIENLIKNQDYAILLYKSIYGSADVFVNGKPVYISGTTTGKKNSSIKSLRHMRPVFFTSDKDGVVDLVLHVSNFEIARGGILLVPKIGSAHCVDKVVLKNIAFESILAGVLFILAIYNLIIYLLNKHQKMYLHLALLSFDLVCVSITLDFSLISYLAGDMGVGSHYKLVLIFLALIIPLYNLYATNLYGIKVKWNWIILLIDFAIPLYYIVFPIIITSKVVLVILSMAILYINSIYLCWVIIKKSRTPKMLYTFNVIIIIAMLITALYGLMIGQYEISGNSGIFFFKVAIMCFAICQSSIAGVKRDLLSSENKNLLVKYEKLNDSYKKFIPVQVTDIFQKDVVDEIEPGDNSICDGMILYGLIKPDWKTNNYSDSDYYGILDNFYNGLLTISKTYKGFFAKSSENSFTIVFTEKNDKVIRCAIEIQKYITAYNRKNSGKSVVVLEIGIHSSKIAIGFVGNDKHLASYNCSAGIDDTRKICAMNKALGSNVLITEQALDYCRTYIEALYEGVIIELDGMKTLIYKVVPFDNATGTMELLTGDDE